MESHQTNTLLLDIVLVQYHIKKKYIYIYTHIFIYMNSTMNHTFYQDLQ